MVAPATAAYVWEDPGDSIMIQISLDVVERLGEAVQQSLGAGPRGEEIGGILLGRLSSEDGRLTQIEDFELVPCEHLRGASYTLAPGDREILGTQLARRRPRQVVGYFRSHTRPGLYLDQDDYTVISHYFADPAQVFLVVRPASEGPATGGFFFWEENDINRKAPYREFPFDRERLLSGGYSIADQMSLAPAQPAPVSTPRRVAPRRPVSFRFRLPHVPWMAVPILGGMFLLAGLFVSQKNTPKSASAPVQPVTQHSSVLALNAERAGNEVRLRWDPNAPAVQKADLGVLWITDGTQRQRRDLSPQELAAGTTTYAPVSKDLNFELQVFALTDRTTKSVQWMAPSEVPVPTPAAPVPTAANVAQTAHAPAPTVPPAPAAQHPKKQQVAKAEATPAPQAPAPVNTARALPEEVPAPPALTPAERVQPRLTGVLAPHTVAPPPSPSVAVTYEPVHGSMFKRAFHRISALGDNESKESFVPPAPVHKVSPAGAGGEGAVSIKLFIDETGYVTKVQLLTRQNELANASIAAALQWRFKPARKHDQPVPSEMVVHFRFGG